MEDIARQSGFAKPTLYYYYTNKEAIFDDVVIEEAQLLMDTAEAELPPNLTAPEEIATFFRLIYAKLKQHVEKVNQLPDYLCEHSPHGHPIIQKLNDLFEEKLTPMLHRGVTKDELHIKDIAVTAKTLVFMSEFLNLDWMRFYEEELRDEIVETMIHTMINGMTRRQ